jgi:DNA-binding CsgD family transcriptional regulator
MANQRCPLSPAQLELLQACRDSPDADADALGEMLFRSPETVRTELREIYRRLNVHTRAGALLVALRHGWLTLPPPHRRTIRRRMRSRSPRVTSRFRYNGAAPAVYPSPSLRPLRQVAGRGAQEYPKWSIYMWLAAGYDYRATTRRALAATATLGRHRWPRHQHGSKLLALLRQATGVARRREGVSKRRVFNRRFGGHSAGRKIEKEVEQ